MVVVDGQRLLYMTLTEIIWKRIAPKLNSLEASKSIQSRGCDALGWRADLKSLKYLRKMQSPEWWEGRDLF